MKNKPNPVATALIMLLSVFGIILVLLLFVGCSSDSIDPIPTEPKIEYCDCQQELIQVTIDDRHIIQGTQNTRIKCTDNGKEFAKVYNGDRLIQYKKYNCN